MEESIESRKQKLREELERLKIEFKVELPKRIAEARAYGDMRENAEYEAAKERQAFVNARITQLSNQLSQLNSFNMSDISKEKIGFGSTVIVRDLESGDRMEFTFVSPNEVKPSERRISLSSPFGQALSNRSAGDTVEVNIPAGKRAYIIEKFTTFHGDTFEIERG
jgi:transcription elongation factor GreA